jgi:hypothetical protein
MSKVRIDNINSPRRAIHIKCRECLCLGDGDRGWDCQIAWSPDGKDWGERGCPLYPYMPWKGKPMPKALRPENEQ